MTEVKEVAIWQEQMTQEKREQLYIAEKAMAERWFQQRVTIKKDAKAWHAQQAAKGIILEGEFNVWFKNIPITEKEMEKKSDEAEEWYQQEVAKRQEAIAAHCSSSAQQQK